MVDIAKVLKKYFGYSEFKNGQEELVRGVLAGKDALGIMPTGGGKSLCYQLPAVLMRGITIVISPLISLMKDQVDSLNEIGIPGTYINSTLDHNEVCKRLNLIKDGRYKIIYVAPERLNTYSFTDLMGEVDITMVAVDEAHCISQWGHDFRPSYLEIPGFINSLARRPIVAAYTATATLKVTEEIKGLLRLKNPVESIVGFDRPNLLYRIVKVSDKLSYVIDYMESNFIKESGIIYCATRKTVESLADRLKDIGISAVGYHGGMPSDIRKRHQDAFVFGKVRVIVATNAFGMGIDKPDVRFVIHYNMPQNMESYYQEAGRAGRDGEPSDCILMYSPADIVKQKFLIENSSLSQERETLLYENLQYLIDYCHTDKCLRKTILEYFNEDVNFDSCDNCGNCLDKSEMVDITIEAQKILSCIYRMREGYGITLVVQVLRGSKNKRVLSLGLDELSTYNIMGEYSEPAIKDIIMTLVSKGYIDITADRYPVLKLTSKSWQILKDREKVYHKRETLEMPAPRKSSKEGNALGQDHDYDEKLFEKLRQLRYDLATKKELAAYMVFHDSALKEMATYFPQDKKSFLKVKGVGSRKYESYGDEFIEAIKEYCTERNIEPKTPKGITMADDNLKDRYEKTYECYLEDLSLEEIAKRRGYKTNTIINHLERCESIGLEVEWSKFIENPKTEEKILDAIDIVGLEKLKPIKELLPDKISYDDIKIVIIKNGLN